ncbi:integrase [Burkholderia ubonensis]|uniref:tyrosine-type recombinase/integrase n=1 Tax=Burkholderia ubonensis TaxID=101571 RepID=UPI00075BDB95|nr:integrase arm-type DNA-binding domain-containing protein [Burkholderia ubonensis]KWE77262.1 integrase [Burkholderia ubonensis]
MRLTNIAIRNAKPAERPRKLADGRGLYLLITPTGSRCWRWKYRFHGREKLMAFGVYPEVSLAEARDKHMEARKLLSSGVDPMEKRREAAEVRPYLTFRQAAEQWYEYWKPSRGVLRQKQVASYLKADIYPVIGRRPVADIPSSVFRDMAKRIEARGAPAAAKLVLQVSNQVMRYSVAHDWAERNPVADLRAGDLLAIPRTKNHARLGEAELPAFLHAIDGYCGEEVTRLAFRMMSLTFVRTGELVEATWSEFDLDGARWTIPAERMKMDTAHIVPLSNQALATLKRLREISAGGEYVFPGRASHLKHMSRGTMLVALRAIGYRGRMTIHGFRGVASTILHEQDWPYEHIELQLAHQSRGKVSAAYNHAQYLPQREEMMQAWADYLDAQRARYISPV